MASFLQSVGIGLLEGTGKHMTNMEDQRLKQEALKAKQLREDHLLQYSAKLEQTRHDRDLGETRKDAETANTNAVNAAKLKAENDLARTKAGVTVKPKKLGAMPVDIKSLFYTKDDMGGEVLDREKMNEFSTFVRSNGLGWANGYNLYKQMGSNGKAQGQSQMTQDIANQMVINAKKDGVNIDQVIAGLPPEFVKGATSAGIKHEKQQKDVSFDKNKETEQDRLDRLTAVNMAKMDRSARGPALRSLGRNQRLKVEQYIKEIEAGTFKSQDSTSGASRSW